MGDDRKLVADAAHHLADCELLFPRLSQALASDTLPMDKVLSIMHARSAASRARQPHEVIDTYFALLDYYQWEPQTQRHDGSAISPDGESTTKRKCPIGICGACLIPAMRLEIEGATRVYR